MASNLRLGSRWGVSALVLLGAACGGKQTSSVAGAGGLPEQPLAAVGPQQHANKLDVLFVVDNSEGMGEQQSVLLKSVPAFIAHLVNPPCLDAAGEPEPAQPASAAEACPSGARALTPVTDMHLGVITTSIGSHGGDICNSPDPHVVDPHLDDQAELIPAKRAGVASYMDSGFASWDAAGQTGDSDPVAVSAQVQAMIGAVGTTGCGFEAPLEAMYRFLVDPEPPVSVEKSITDQQATPVGINQELLQQRAAFLRPDSALAVVILSEENDCSIVDSGVGWFVGSSSRMPKATAACAANPNDRCCRSCAQNEVSPPSGCKPLNQDSVCAGSMTESYNTWPAADDSVNLRCFDQMRRFGFDLLNPLWRYSDGLTNPTVYDRAGKLVQNPLLAGRSASLVSVSLIVGAPWQDLATDDSLSSASALTFLSASGLEGEQRWPLLLGDPANNVPPSDPLMVESIDPRTGTSPLTGAPLVPASSTDPQANPGNGHEQYTPDRSELQYACTFALTTPRPCANGDQDCLCSPSDSGNSSAVTAANSPACQPPTGGPAGTTQYYAVGYPGTRELLFGHALGDRVAPASICPKQTSDDGPSFGYVPALDALARRIGVTLE